jgi:hypothetical protein
MEKPEEPQKIQHTAASAAGEAAKKQKAVFYHCVGSMHRREIGQRKEGQW